MPFGVPFFSGDFMDKELIRKRFSRRLKSYHNKAVEQKKMAAQLIEMAKPFFHDELQWVLEIGCGTGFLTEILVDHSICTHLISNDIVSECKDIVQSIHPKIEFIPGDVEALDLKKASFDGVFSGAVFQWIENWPGFFQKISEWLKPEGFFVFSSFGPDNYQEIKKTTGVGLKYYSLKEAIEILKTNFTVLDSHEYREEFYFPNGLELLKHIRNTGVNGLEKQVWTRDKLRTFENTYQSTFPEKEGRFALTYHPYFIVAQKKDL